MRAQEFVNENFGVQVYPGVIPFGAYLNPDPEFAPPGNYRDSVELHDEVYDLIDGGVEPEVVTLDPKSLLATQDWLSNAGGDDPLFDEYTDRPVIYKKAGRLYILDGHHRSTRALRASRPISVYLFSDEQLDENFAEGKNPTQDQVVKSILQSVPKAKEIWFHGSRATGKHRPDSDTDILVVVPGDVVGDEYLENVMALQDVAQKFHNYDIQPTKSNSNIYRISREEGQLLWSAIDENFNDGKNPGRKGLAKRMGVNTKASVSSLRKTAKNSSGEKQRMAHWLANMKSGRNKKK